LKMDHFCPWYVVLLQSTTLSMCCVASYDIQNTTNFS
jgi:hypothetical protein